MYGEEVSDGLLEGVFRYGSVRGLLLRRPTCNE